ncbi:hypothetical protein LIER_40400 [Lithospermum erythrorhizon]|uniref:Uncharacterized protein n=1 Tax=Lithospermum erythrorhizon TaxID=34254 RepID=A0AAV3QTV9_LITER
MKIWESDDEAVIVSLTASRRRTKSCAAALEKKKTVLGLGGEDVDNSMEPSEAVNLEEMERKVEEKKRIEKGKGKAKRPNEVHASGSTSKKRRGIVVSDSKSPVRGDRFVVDDVAESDKECIAKSLRERSKDKLKINDSRNRINNKRIAKDVKEIPTDGVDFCSKEHETRWKFVCARNILPEREFVSNLFEEIKDPASLMFHKAANSNLVPTSNNTNISEALACLSLNIHMFRRKKKEDGLGEDAKPLTISDKLVIWKHVIDVELNAIDQSEPVPEGEAAGMLIEGYEEELYRLEAEIHVKNVGVKIES